MTLSIIKLAEVSNILLAIDIIVILATRDFKAIKDLIVKVIKYIKIVLVEEESF